MHNRKKNIVAITAIATVIIVLLSAYIVYGNSKINFDSDESLINKLSANEEDTVTILAKKTYKEYAAVMYTVSTDEKVHFAYLKKSPYFTNRYDIKGGGSTNNGVDCTKVQNDSGDLIFFIYNNADKASNCSLFQITSDGMISNKIEEIKTPGGPFIIVKEYNFDDKGSEIIVFDGSKTLEEVNQYFWIWELRKKYENK